MEGSRSDRHTGHDREEPCSPAYQWVVRYACGRWYMTTRKEGTPDLTRDEVQQILRILLQWAFNTGFTRTPAAQMIEKDLMQPAEYHRYLTYDETKQLIKEAEELLQKFPTDPDPRPVARTEPATNISWLCRKPVGQCNWSCQPDLCKRQHGTPVHNRSPRQPHLWPRRPQYPQQLLHRQRDQAMRRANLRYRWTPFPLYPRCRRRSQDGDILSVNIS